MIRTALIAAVMMTGFSATAARAEGSVISGSSVVDDLYRNIGAFYRNIGAFYRNIGAF